MAMEPGTTAAGKRHETRLAVCRGGDTIELYARAWHADEQQWQLTGHLYAGQGSSVRTLMWLPGGRLFSGSLAGELCEWDVQRREPRFTLQALGGGVWQLAAHPSQHCFAAAFEDGTARVFQLSDHTAAVGDTFTLLYALPCHAHRVVSVAWSRDGASLAVGSDRSTVKLWQCPSLANDTNSKSKPTATSKTDDEDHIDFLSSSSSSSDSDSYSDPFSSSDDDDDDNDGPTLLMSRASSGTTHPRCVRTVRMPRVQDSKKTVVWSLQYVDGETLATGDSNGSVAFWDAKLGTLLGAYQAHTADVPCLSLAAATKTLYSAGSDGRVVQFRELDGQWRQTLVAYPHVHDIHALVQTPGGELLLSGGVDATLTLTRTDTFGDAGDRKLYPSCRTDDDIATAPAARLAVCRRRSALQLWKIGSRDESVAWQQQQQQQQQYRQHTTTTTTTSTAVGTVLEQPSLLASVNFDGVQLVGCHVSPCGGYVAAACTAKVWLFAVSPSARSLRALRLPLAREAGYTRLRFGAGGVLFVCSLRGGLQAVDLASRRVTTLRPAAADRAHVVDTLAVSADGRWLAAADASNAIDVYDVAASSHHARLPQLHCRHTAMSFEPATARLFVATADHAIHVYDPAASPPASLSLCSAASDLLRPDLLHSGAVVQGIAFCGDSLVVWCSARAVFLSPLSAVAGPAASLRATSAPQFRHLLHLDCLADGQLVTFERNWKSIVDSLPAPVHRRRFRT